MQLLRARKFAQLSFVTLVAFAGSFSSGCRSGQSWPLFEQYSQRFINPDGRVIDHSDGDKTTSEGESYAMFFSLVANDRMRFDKILHWTESNLAEGDLSKNLPAWSYGKTRNGGWDVNDYNSAADSDLWIAYSLIEAGRVWDEPRYQKLGMAMAAHIAEREVVLIPGLGTTLVAGGDGFHPNDTTWILNPSYLPLPVLTRLADEMPEGPWRSIIASLGPLLGKGSGSGYAMDWVSAGNGIHPGGTPAQIVSGWQEAPAYGSYDAIRVYLWLGISDPDTPGRSELLGDVSGMANYMRSQQVPPERIDSTGKVNSANGPLGFTAALIPYLEANNMKSEARVESERLASGKDGHSGLYGAHPRYYDQNLALFSTGWSEERYRFRSDGRLRLKWTQ